MKVNTTRSKVLAGVICTSTLPIGLAAPQVFAQENAAAIDEVVVTARRRAENIQDVPVSVSAFDAVALEDKGVSDITELQQRLPNTTLQVSRATNSTLTAYIRGIGQQDPLWGYEPGVGIYIDDVYIARPQGAVLEVLDVENIEVLRGPQGTLYGKNTIGGALKYQTRQLGNDPRFSVTGRAGSYGRKDINVAGSTPLIEDKLFFGAGVAWLQRDGFGEFVNTGDDNYNKDVMSGHMKLEWAALDNLRVTVAADRTDDDSNPRGGYRLTPSLVTGQLPYGDKYDSDASLPNNNEVTIEGASLKFDWDINDRLVFKSITSSREGYTYTDIDFDSTSVNTFDVPAEYEDEQFTQEFQLNYSDSQLDLVGGVYYFHGEACGAFDVVLGLAGITLENGGCVDTDSYSAFAHGNYNFNESWSMSFGGRYTTDEKQADVYRYVYAGTKFPQYPLTQPDLSQLATLGYFGPAAVQSDFVGDESWNQFSPHVGVQFRVNDQVMVYGSYTNGFKSGGFDMRANVAVYPKSADPFDPEIVDAFEAGIKSTLLDSRLRLNAAVFFNDYQDQQVTIQRQVGPSNFASQVVNAGQSEMRGLELEMQAALTDSLTLSATVGYIDAEFVSIEYDAGFGNIVDVSDEWVVSNTPEWNANLSMDYGFNLGGWNGNANLGWVFRDDTYIFEVPSALDQEAYSLVNAGIVFTSPNDRLTIGIHGKNLTNEEYRVAGYNFGATFDSNGNLVAPGLGGDDTVTAFYGDPRTFMISASINF